MMNPFARALISRYSGLLLTGILLGFSVQAWAYSGDTIQDDIAREFNGATSYTIPLSAPPQSVPTTPPANNCAATLQQEMGDGQISTDEQCDCPVGATQPVCTALPASDCPNLLQIEENRLGSDAQYEDCTCPTGASTPQCTSYYQLCEAALPNYQNSTNECTCSQEATSAVPNCESDYDICESHAGSYETGNTTCTCSQTSTEPNCCTSTTMQDCTTSQTCTTTQNCSQVIDGYQCDNSYASGGLQELHCGVRGVSGGYVTPTNGYASCSASFCGSTQPYCLFGSGSNGGGRTMNNGPQVPAHEITTESCQPDTTCTPVTTCHPVTTQSCKTE